VFDALRDVDVHALPFPSDAPDSEPLLVRVPVVYTLDAAETEGAEVTGAPLVVADPTGTLPAARREGESTAAALDAGARTLFGAEATRARVLEVLPTASALYYSGHAAYAGVDGWDSALFVANGERVAVADLLALPRSPRLVVLAGCETGRESERGGAAGLGLAEAFIAAGSRAVIASPRVVRDADAESLSRALVASLAETPDDPAAALRRAELDRRRAGASADWSAFRALTR
jgi:CHAT domain-containing protein